MGVEQRLIILFVKTSTMMAASKFWSFFFVIWCLGFKGIIKPKLVLLSKASLYFFK